MDAVEGVAGEFNSYEDYLDSQITETDLYYLEDEELARQLVVSIRLILHMLRHGQANARRCTVRIQRPDRTLSCCGGATAAAVS
jgi:hypothetical protein